MSMEWKVHEHPPDKMHEVHYFANVRRQIHNAFQTALAFAEWNSRSVKGAKEKGLVLRVRHFQKVAKVSEGFDQYIMDLFGGRDEATRAKINQVRDDYHTPNNAYNFHLGQKDRQDQLFPPATTGATEDDETFDDDGYRDERKNSKKVHAAQKAHDSTSDESESDEDG